MKLSLEQLALLEHILWRYTDNSEDTIENADTAESIRLAAQKEYKELFATQNFEQRMSEC